MICVCPIPGYSELHVIATIILVVNKRSLL